MKIKYWILSPAFKAGLLNGQAEVLLSGHHTNGVGVAHTATPALNTDDGVALVDDAELETVVDGPLKAAVDVLLPDLDVEVGLLLGEVEGPHATVQVGVPGGGVVTGDHQNGAHGAVLGEQTGGLAGGGQNDNGTGVQLQRGADGGHGHGLAGLGRARSQVAQLIEDLVVGDGDLGQQTGLVHHLDGLTGVVTLGGLTGQHDTVGTVENGVGNIGDLSTGGAGVICHGLEHLSGTDDGLALDVALGDHHLLGHEDLGGGDLDTEVTTGDHDTVGLLEDLVEVVDTLLVLDLGNDLDLTAVLAENITDALDIAAATDERSEDHVDLVLNTEAQIGNILLGQSGEVYVGTGQVDTLAGGDVAVVQALGAQVILIQHLEDLK